MILFIFRSLAWLSTIGLGVFFILNPSSSNAVLVEIQRVEDELVNLQSQMESDKNKTENEELELSKQSTAFRERTDLAKAEEIEIDEELEGISAKSEELDKQVAEKKEELESLNQELAKAGIPLGEIELQGKPLFDREISLKESIKKLESDLAVQKEKADAIASELAVLEMKRKKSEDNFNSEKERLTVDVKKPYHLHFADKKEVVVRNKVPSGKGVFIDAGYRDGFRNGMEFLGEKLNDRSALPFRAELGLVQDSYSYLKFISVEGSGFSTDSLREDERILLTRSGKLSLLRKDKELADSNFTTVVEN